MNSAVLAYIAQRDAVTFNNTPAGCVNDGVRRMDGTGPHLALRHPWWNDGIHDLTDTTWFRWLMLFAVGHYVYINFLRR